MQASNFESMTQGLKPTFFRGTERAKPEGLGYLETVRAFARRPTSQNRDMGRSILWLQPDVGHPANYEYCAQLFFI
jgi:hypothetical protein